MTSACVRCVCVCAHVCNYMCKCICMWGPEVNFRYCSLGTTHHVFDMGSLTSLKLTSFTVRTGWLASEPRGSFNGSLPSVGITNTRHHSQIFLCGFCWWNSFPCACMTRLYQLSHLPTSHFKDLCLPWHLSVWRWTSLILFPDVTLATSKNSAFNKV